MFQLVQMDGLVLLGEFDEDRFSEINPGNIFRTVPNSQSRQFRKLNENEAIDVVKQELIKFDSPIPVELESSRFPVKEQRALFVLRFSMRSTMTRIA